MQTRGNWGNQIWSKQPFLFLQCRQSFHFISQSTNLSTQNFWVLLWIAAEHILWTFSHLVHVCMGMAIMAITNIGIVATLICGRPHVSQPPSVKYGLGIWYAVALDQIFHAHSVKSVVWGCVMPRLHFSLSECEKCGLGTRLYCVHVLQLTLKSTAKACTWL